MITISSTLTEEKKEQLREARNSPDAMFGHGVLQNGKEYYLKILVTDDIAAEDLLLSLLHGSSNYVVGKELLGFSIQSLAWSGVNRLETYQQELMNFMTSGELEQRVKARENTP